MNSDATTTGADLIGSSPLIYRGQPTKDGPRTALEKDEKKAAKRSVFSIWDVVVPLVLLTAAAAWTRLYRIGKSPIVTWDEAHFGKFGSHYLKREFYFDVHPPLGKLLVGASGYLAGYNGSFEFKSGDTYPDEVDYTFMRAFNAAFGIVCVPLGFMTARALRLSQATAWLVGLMVLCETSYTAISRFILLDSMLLFGTFATVFCWANFHETRKTPVTRQWFMWLALTGISIGFVCSVKMVGLFCTALVGLHTAVDLWRMLGNTRVDSAWFGWLGNNRGVSKSKVLSVTDFSIHAISRVVFLIVLPFCAFMLSFWIHFVVLKNSGPGDAQMSSLFQANLRGSTVGKDSPFEVAVGSRVTIKNMGYGGGLLHSHVQTYPEGSHQQQVTCYHHKDTNNDWFFYPARDQVPFDANETVRYIHHGDTVRLIHSQTGRNLHSHSIAAPMTTTHKEVSAYGNETVGDAKDHWIVEVVKDVGARDSEHKNHPRLRTLTTSFRLKHASLGCYLRAANVNLPQWGFKQIEVTCIPGNKHRASDEHSKWNIESHSNTRLPAAKAGSYKSPFLHDFVHLNVAMMTSNNALVPDPDKQDDLSSEWWQWPILHVGLRMCNWESETVKHFLLGNPLVYWGSTASLGLFLGLVGWYLIRWQRGYNDLTTEEAEHILQAGIFPFIGWVLHYLPFVVMARVTYVHHYYPALYFAILVFAFCVDWIVGGAPEVASRQSKTDESTIRRVLRIVIYGGLYISIIGLYWHFRHFFFGMDLDKSKYKHLAWLPNWHISD